MTKDELLEAIKDYPDHWEVRVECESGGTHKIVDVELMPTGKVCFGGSKLLIRIE